MKGVSWEKDLREKSKREGGVLFCFAVDNFRQRGIVCHSVVSEETARKAIRYFTKLCEKGEI